MKLRCFTSLIVTMVMMVSTAGAVEVYNKNGNTLNTFGNIVGGQCFSKNNFNKGCHSFMRYGLIGKTYVNDNIYGFGKWEHEFFLQNVETGINLREYGHSILGYAGIKFGNFGSIDYGRNYGLLYDVVSWTDLVSEFGEDLSISDNFLSGRASNLITYRNHNFFGFLNGFNFAIQYQGKNDINQSTGRTVKTANGDGYGISASYSLRNGIATSAAYVNSKRTLEQQRLDNLIDTNDTAEAYSVGLKYDAHGVYVAATYGETYNMTPFGKFSDVLNPDNIYGFANKTRNVEFTARYRFNWGFIPSISYLYSKISDVDNGYGNDFKKCVTISTGYAFNKNVFTTMSYRVNLLNKNDFTTAAQVCIDDALAVGISYLF